MRTLKLGPIVLIAVATFSSAALAERGDLKIKFKLTRAMAKAPPAIKGVFDPGEVGPDLEVPNVMVWLHTNDPGKIKVHPALAEKTAIQKPHLEINSSRYVPHCLIITAGQTLNMTNVDAIGYNPLLAFSANLPINVLLPAGGVVEKPILKAERRPAGISCSVHPWMQGWLMVAPTPYHAVSNAEGTITIKDLPVGKWEFKVWHEVHGYIGKVERGGKLEIWNKGTVSLSIAEGENDLGEIKIVPKEE